MSNNFYNTKDNVIEERLLGFISNNERSEILELIMDSIVTVHPLSQTPTRAWEELSKTQNATLLTVKNPTKKVKPGHIRIVCMSDTHSEDENFKFKVPDGDIFVHAGDFSRRGAIVEIIKFNEWMKSLPHKNKIVIAGNHELSFDEKCILFGACGKEETSVEAKKKLLTNCTYLEDSSVTLFGIKFYGAPWQPEYGGWAFNVARGERLLAKWNLIPDDTDILITHGPPLGHGDQLAAGGRAGCAELLATVQKRVKPKYHIFGHIHEGYGMSTDGSTIFINASTCNRHYLPKNIPIVFDIPVPEGCEESSLIDANENKCCNFV